jgi:triacylglycerol lipase
MVKATELPAVGMRVVRRTLAEVASEAQEALSVVAAAALYPTGWFEGGPGGRTRPHVVDGRFVGPPAAGRADGWPTPVLLVHGWLANKSNWLVVERELRSAGLEQIHAMSYRPLPLDLELLGARCVVRAREVMEECGADRIHLVGHSLGGLVSRWAVQVGGLHEAATVQTVASPHGGVPLAGLNRRAKASQHIAVGSPVLARMHRAPAPPDTEFVAYWSELDAVVPPPFGEIRERRLGAENVRVPRRGHLSIVLSRKVAADIAGRAAAAERDVVRLRAVAS